MWKFEGRWIRFRVWWKVCGDSMLYEFFKVVSDKLVWYFIIELCIDLRWVIIGYSEVEEVCMWYYCNFFDFEGSVLLCKKEEVDCFLVINYFVLDFMV